MRHTATEGVIGMTHVQAGVLIVELGVGAVYWLLGIVGFVRRRP